MKREIYDEDHEAFRSSVREFLERSVIPNVEQHAVDKAIPREFWLEAGKQGFLGLEIPEEYGGAGADDYRFNAVMAEELSKVNAALGSCWGIHADITAPYIVAMGTEEQKQRWLPGVASGEILLAIGMTEPSGGSDLAALKTTAVKDGDDWVINGSKTFITNGYSADLVVTAVRTDPEKGARGITLFAIPADAPGFSRGRKLDKVGQDESDTAELFFEDVRLGEDHIIGELGGGFIAMMQKLPRSAWAARSATSRTPSRSCSRRSSTPRTARPSVPRSAPSSTTSSSWPSSSPPSRSPRPTSTSASSPTTRASSPRSTPPRPSGGAARSRTTCSTTASSCTAATAS